MSQTQLHNVRVYGLGLTDDFLLHLSSREQTKSIPHATPEGYDLPPKTPLEEAILDAWDDARKAWAKFQTHQTDPWSGWLRPLLKTLDYSFAGSSATSQGGKYTVKQLSETRDVPLHYTNASDLDRVTDESGQRISPHGLLQGYLNHTPDHLWGLLSNGETLRLLRDNAQVTRAAYLEFNLGEMMRGEDAKAFRVLWLTLHRSRLKGATASILETWNTSASVEGVKARDSLQQNVKAAIEHLGTGFLQANPSLLEATKTSATGATALYRACLKLVYQLVFVFVTEDRDLLFERDEHGAYIPDAQTRERAAHYLTKALRGKATRVTGNPLHRDAYAGWERLLSHLREGFAPLGLPGLGSHLFAPHELTGLDLSNAAFYATIRDLAQIRVAGNTRPVNYAGLDSEELGSIYESLLELVPRIQPGPRLELQILAGNERKTTGSYYTPSGLIELLLESALDPVLNEATSGKQPSEAIAALLNLKVIDPACGSGHFLIAAARRIGVRLAELTEETSQPSPSALRRATRRAIAHCVYGADINPMAVELAKVALWLEAQDAGKPLAFLDHRLRVGNSLLGTTPELMVSEDEIPGKVIKKISYPPARANTLHLPDEAFTPLEGDDKATVSALKKRNKLEREEQIRAAFGVRGLGLEATGTNAILLEYQELDAIEPDNLQATRRQERKFKEILEKKTLQNAKLLADAWCAAFVTPKQAGSSSITTATLNALRANPDAPELEGVRVTTREASAQYRFLHPHLEFPDVFTTLQGGFDCVLGNPPWERIKLQEKEWFAQRVPEIASATNASERTKLINALKTEFPATHADFKSDLRQAEGESHFIRSSNRYPLTGRGDVNTYAIFAELNRDSLNPRGRMGIIVPTGIATDDTTKFFFQSLMDKRSLVSLYDFENREAIFPGVHRSFKFCTLSVSGLERPTEAAQFVFFALNAGEVNDPNKRFTLEPSEIALLNPNTRTAPVFRSARDAQITKGIYQRVPVLLNEATLENPWGIRFMAMFHMSADSGLFRTAQQLEDAGWTLTGNRFVQAGETMLPLYEAKLMHQFDHRFATYTEGGDTRDITSAEKANPDFLPISRYWVEEIAVEDRLITTDKDGGIAWQWSRDWLLQFRNIARSTDERSTLFGIIPRVAVGHSSPTMFSDSSLQPILGSLFNSFAVDYSVRQKLGGINMTFGYVQQFPILPPSSFTPERLTFITPRVLELTYTAHDLTGFARDLGFDGAPFTWHDERRFWLRCELDALYFMLYGIARADVEYIMETFPIVRGKDVKAHGAYRTKDVILEVFDALSALGIDRILEYRSRVPGGAVAGGWTP